MMISLITSLLSSSFAQVAAIIGDNGPCSKGDFFGLLPWYYYLPSSDLDASTCSIREFHILGANADLPLVLLAVVDDLLRIAGLVAIGFVIVGAIRYTTSQGNAEDAAKAQSTVINALIGLALATVAVGIVSFLGAKLGG
jgi:Type IV secretion system pilin